MRVAVVVPWRGGCPHRERAWAWIRDRYATEHPRWQLIEAPAPPGAWCKAAAVTPAIEQVGADVMVVADADCWTSGLEDAVEQVALGATWAVPHLLVHRLTEHATSQLLAGSPPSECEQPPYPGVLGGGFVAAPREVLRSIPIDPRFTGWGQEDESWAFALQTLLGAPWRGTAELVHCWHPSQQRMSRTRGTPVGWQLRRRYGRARAHPAAMRALLEETRHADPDAHQPSVHHHTPLGEQ